MENAKINCEVPISPLASLKTFEPQDVGNTQILHFFFENTKHLSYYNLSVQSQKIYRTLRYVLRSQKITQCFAQFVHVCPGI